MEHCSLTVHCCLAVAALPDLTGTVPAQLSRLTHLTQLDLEFNFLHGELTQGQLCGAANNSLQAVYIRANNFTGPLNLTQCRHLEVADIQVGSRAVQSAGAACLSLPGTPWVAAPGLSGQQQLRQPEPASLVAVSAS